MSPVCARTNAPRHKKTTRITVRITAKTKIFHIPYSHTSHFVTKRLQPKHFSTTRGTKSDKQSRVFMTKRMHRRFAVQNPANSTRYHEVSRSQINTIKNYDQLNKSATSIKLKGCVKLYKPTITARHCGCPLLARLVQSDSGLLGVGCFVFSVRENQKKIEDLYPYSHMFFH